REDPVLSHNDRQHTRAIALSAQVVAIHRWWGTEHRLVVANLGHEVDLALPDIKSLLTLRYRPWTLLFSTADPRFTTNARPPTISGIGGHRRIQLPARAAAIWEIAG
ncbi:MAG TPA: DUF3459 domain-containing protein, partial [Thermomicrobiales bacterium]|nr:DUF3459 domain-containing protein [Thermomicrobiales bacterium]